MLRGLAVLLAIGLTVYALIDAFRTDEREMQGLPKVVWVLVILLLPLFGPLAWILLGRARPAGGPAPGEVRGRGPAPDDDPDFLRQLEIRRRHQADEERLRRWEEDLRRREQGGPGSGGPGSGGSGSTPDDRPSL